MELVTKDHLLCKIETVIDFSFILDRVLALPVPTMAVVHWIRFLMPRRFHRTVAAASTTSVTQDIFDVIVEQVISQGLVNGTVPHTDSTHLKGNANKNRYNLEMPRKSRADYWADLD